MQATPRPKRGIETFIFTLIALAALRVVLQVAGNVPLSIVPIANVVMGCLFLGGPLLALFFAARNSWDAKRAFLFFVFGVVLQVGCFVLNDRFFGHSGIPSQVINALGQVGLPIWCVGLGALLATLIKDRNIIVPIAIFLVFLDSFLVFSPFGLTQVLMKAAPSFLPAMAAQIPAASHAPHGAKVAPGALAGPADFMFLAMFLVAIFKHNMQGKRTAMVVIPTLLVYMLIVNVVRISLPALVPIGIVVLTVNWKEFQLSKDEKLSTGLVALLGLGLFTWGMFQKPQVERAEPSPSADVQGSVKSPNLPAPNEVGRPR